MTPSHRQTKAEQRRQAKTIHGGLVKMGIAWLGVKLADMPIPRRFRASVFRQVFGGKYDPLKEDEAEKPIEEYRSLNDVFTRGLKPEVQDEWTKWPLYPYYCCMAQYAWSQEDIGLLERIGDAAADDQSACRPSIEEAIRRLEAAR